MPASEVSVARLTASVEALVPAINSLREDVRVGQAKAIEVLIQLQETRTTLVAVKDDIDELTKVVRVGNSQPSLLTRMTQLEVSYGVMTQDVRTLKDKYDTVVTAKILTRGQIIAGVVGMITTAILALGAICAQLFK